jgi:hypothetical protein
MTNEENNEPYAIFYDSDSPLVKESPAELLSIVGSGEFSRIDAWNVLQLVHSKEIECELPQYGMLTVFSLSRDLKQFQSLYDQGCEMLRENGILKPEVEEEAIRKLLKTIKQELGDHIKIKIVKKTKKTKNKSNPNNRLN